MPEWFSYLKHLDIPAKYKISHTLIEKLIASDLSLVDDTDELQYNDIIDHGELTKNQQRLEDVMKNLSTKEAAFQIAQLEYEKKETRFLELTNYNQAMLDQLYAQGDLALKDINDEKVLQAIEERNYEELIDEIGVLVAVIAKDVEIFRERKSMILDIWKVLSQELMDKIKSFEFRGLKVISTNLRVKLIPELEEFKIALRDYNLKDDSISRGRIEVELKEMVERAREDIYGELTSSQIVLLEDISPDLTKDELIRILTDETMQKDLVVLLETDKIDLKMKKVIDRLI